MDPIAVSNQLRHQYLSYLTTTFGPKRASRFSEVFTQLLSRDGQLVNGPYLEATAPFAAADCSLEDLVRDGTLCESFRQLFQPRQPSSSQPPASGGLFDDLPAAPQAAAQQDPRLSPSRPLYAHQLTALQRLCGRQGDHPVVRNTVVASGTGSGKTECFLLPAIDWILRHPTSEGGRGLRVLLVYPMNALVNDQIRRLRELVGFRADCGEQPIAVRFGRYTGETETDSGKARKQDPAAPDNQVLSREEMLADPPDLLITNFAMLEQTLLRPNERALFEDVDEHAWRFLILDEAHSYRGAKAIELARLMDRVRAAVRRGKRERSLAGVDPVCVATSATLADPSGGEQSQREQTARFATDLFGSPFEPDSVVLAERKMLETQRTEWSFDDPEQAQRADEALAAIPPSILTRLDDVADQPWKQAFQDTAPDDLLRRPASRDGESRRRFLYELFKSHPRFHWLWSQIQQGPRPLTQLSAELEHLPVDDRSQALQNLVTICNAAQHETNSQPLLPCRYHFFASALEGLFCVLASDQERESSSLESDDRGASASSSRGIPEWGVTEIAVRRIQPADRVAFEMAYCNGCHQLLVVADDLPGTSGLDSPPVWMRPVRFFTIEPVDEQQLHEKQVDLSTGRVAEATSDPAMLRTLYEVIPTKSGTDISQCPGCGHKGGAGQIAMRFQTGQDVPVGILTETLYGQLPAAGDSQMQQLKEDFSTRYDGASDPPSGRGRKLIIFSDSRQNAAYTASFLQQRHSEHLFRQIAFHALPAEGQVDLDAWSHDCAQLIDRSGLILPYLKDIDLGDPAYTPFRDSYVPRSDAQGRLNRIRSLLLAELTGSQPNCLEALGLIAASWDLASALGLDESRLSQEVNLSDVTLIRRPTWRDLLDLSSRALDLMRRGRVVHVPTGVDAPYYTKDPPLLMFQKPNNAKSNVSSFWNIQAAPTNYGDLVVRWLAAFGGGDEQSARSLAQQVFDQLFERLVGGGILRADTVAGGRGLQLDVGKLRIERPRSLQRCDVCGAYASGRVTEICTRPRCGGRLETLEPDEFPERSPRRQFYVDRVKTFGEVEMRCEEHTAQLEGDLGREVQEAFQAGQVNVLSCSTTFEMGIDIGSLQAVVMRNVPPSTANYVQRAGRAGRRSDSVAFVLTFCQRRPHDQQHFREPTEIIDGRMKPPVIDRPNQKILLRHLFADCLALYWRDLSRLDPDFGTGGTVGAFFGRVLDALEATPAEHFTTWLSEPARLAEMQRRAAETFPDQAETLEQLFAIMCDADGRHNPLAVTRANVTDEMRSLQRDMERERRKEEEARKADLPEAEKTRLKKEAEQMARSFERLHEQLGDEFLIRYLMNHGVLPSFAFPVNVLRLAVLGNELGRKGARGRPKPSRFRFERDGKIAISEYAPGAEVMAGGRIYASVGLRKFPAQQLDWTKSFRLCSHCGHLQTFLSTDESDNAEALCPKCQRQYEPLSLRPRQFIEPRYGFVTDRGALPRDLTRGRPNRLYAGRAFYVSQQAFPATSLAPASGPLKVESCYATGRSLLILNLGRFQATRDGGLGRRGFHVCPTCGRSVFGGRIGTYAHHVPPYGFHRTCRPADARLFRPDAALGYRYETDVAMLTLHGADRPATDTSFWLSTAYALIHGAVEALNIERADLEVTLVPQPDNRGQDILIYDSVPGGAGHCRHLTEEIESVVEKAREMLAACDCEPSATGCYGCLCDYSNQWAHDQLSRGESLAYLNLLADAMTQKGEQAWRQGRFTLGEIRDSLVQFGDRAFIFVPGDERLKGEQRKRQVKALLDWCEIAERLIENGKSPVRIVLQSAPRLDRSVAESVAYRKLQVLQASGVEIQLADEAPPPVAYAADTEGAKMVWQWQVADGATGAPMMRKSRSGFADKALGELRLPDSVPTTLKEAAEFHHFQIDPATDPAPKMDAPQYLGGLLKLEACRIRISDPFLLHGPRNSQQLLNFLGLIRHTGGTEIKIRACKLTPRKAKHARKKVEEGIPLESLNFTDAEMQQEVCRQAEAFPFQPQVDLLDGEEFGDHDRVILWEVRDADIVHCYRVLLGHGLACFSPANSQRSEGVYFKIAPEKFEQDW